MEENIFGMLWLYHNCSIDPKLRDFFGNKNIIFLIIKSKDFELKQATSGYR